MADFSGAAQGFLNFTQQQQQREMQQVEMARVLQAMAGQKWQQEQQQQAAQRQMAARAGAGRLLYDQISAPPTPPMGQPPPPGASSPGGTPGGGPPPQGGGQPGGMPPGAGPGMMPPPGAGVPPGAPSGGPQMSMAPAQPQQPLPWRPMPQGAPPGPPPGAGGPPQIGPPPAGPGAAPGAAPGESPGGVVPQRTFDLKGMIGTLQKQGVPPEKVMDMLDELAPTMNAANKAELDGYKVQHQLQQDVIRYATDRVRELQKDKEIGIKEREQQSKDRERQDKDKARTESNKIKREKLTAALNSKGGAVKIVKWKEDEDGNTVGGFDRAGHFHKIDEDAPKTSPKAGARTNREIGQLKEDRRSLIARGISEKDPRIKALDQQISEMEAKGRGKDAAGGGGKPTPTDKDRAWVKVHPEHAAKFKATFGVEP